MKKIVTSLAPMLLALLVVEPSLTHAQTSPVVLGSTNGGELVEIDLTAGTVQLIGFAPSPGRWSDLAMDPAGNLYAVSTWAIEPSSVCFGQFGFGPCAHLYRLDPNTGAVIQHIGDLQAAFVSDIDFTASFVLYGSRYVDSQPQNDGGLVTIHPVTASITVPPNMRFGSSMENGGLAVHPLTSELWAVEANPGADLFASIFRVDPSTGLAIPPVVPLGFGGQPATFWFDALEILPDGRFIATIGGGFGVNEIYEINPVPSPSGLAEVTLIPLDFDLAITGHVNGLTVVPETPVDTPEINFHGQLDIVFEDNGSGVYSGVPVGTEFFGAIDDIFSGFISDGTTRTPFTCCLETDDSVFIDNDDVLDADDATLINSLAGTNFVAGDVLDFITIGGSAVTAGGTRIFISLTFVLDSDAFDDDSLGNYPPDPDDILITVFVIEELRSGLTISFDTFDNLGSDAVAIDVLVNGELVGRNLTNPFTDGSFVPVSVAFDADGTLDLTFDGNPIFVDLPTGHTPQVSDRFGFGGRSGTGNAVERIDNVSISACRDTFGCPPPDAEYVNDFSSSVGPASLFGDAVLDSGSVRLIDSINFQLGSLVINDLVPGEAINSFAATFDLQMGPSSSPADGVSFNFGVMPDAAFGEDGPDEEATIYEALGVVDPNETFDDVPTSNFAFDFIETLAASGITSGCGGNNYCPDDSVTRAQMAVFLVRGIHGSGFIPPAATGNTFLDVAANAFAAAFIEQFFLDGITSGCGGNNYCPNDTVTRAQMAVFLLRAAHGAGFIPPPASGVFTDAPLGSFAVAWIEQLAAEGITSGCGGGNYCPENQVTRAQMAVFLVRTFEL